MLHAATLSKTETTLNTPLTIIDPEKIKQHIIEDGIVLIRNSAITVADFEDLSEQLMSKCMVHHGTGTQQRDAVNKEGTTSTVNKGFSKLPFHKEYAYAAGGPDLMVFHCVTPAAQDGETIACDGIDLYAALPQHIKEFVTDAVLKWQWKVPPSRWQTALDVTTTEEALAKLDYLNQQCADWEWQEVAFDGDWLAGAYYTHCVIPTRWQQQKSFCNFLLNFFFRPIEDFHEESPITLTLQDGSEFPIEIAQEILEVADSVTYAHPWQKGDIIALDNSRYMHGRNGFTDKNRNILLRMGHVNF